jgi:hypothetical protein
MSLDQPLPDQLRQAITEASTTDQAAFTAEVRRCRFDFQAVAEAVGGDAEHCRSRDNPVLVPLGRKSPVGISHGIDSPCTTVTL